MPSTFRGTTEFWALYKVVGREWRQGSLVVVRILAPKKGLGFRV